MATIIGAYNTNEESSQDALLKITATDIGTKSFLDSDKAQLAEVIIVSGANTYVCQAPPGTVSSAASWRIKRINVTGTTTTITWADGDASFDNIADNYVGLSYS